MMCPLSTHFPINFIHHRHRLSLKLKGPLLHPLKTLPWSKSLATTLVNVIAARRSITWFLHFVHFFQGSSCRGFRIFRRSGSSLWNRKSWHKSITSNFKILGNSQENVKNCRLFGIVNKETQMP